MTTFRDALLAEIAEQKQLISRLDNHEFGPGAMAQIRAERLALLERLLELEPGADTGRALARES